MHGVFFSVTHLEGVYFSVDGVKNSVDSVFFSVDGVFFPVDGVFLRGGLWVRWASRGLGVREAKWQQGPWR